MNADAQSTVLNITINVSPLRDAVFAMHFPLVLWTKTQKPSTQLQLMFGVNAVEVELLVMVWPQVITLAMCIHAMNTLVVLRFLIQRYRGV